VLVLNKALLLQYRVFKLPCTASRTIEAMRVWFDHTDTPPQFINSSAQIWNGEDMVTLGPVGREDMISEELLKFVPPLFILRAYRTS
jgi:hypothetical protein